MPRVLIIHGIGMNMRGKVQTDIFGTMTLKEYDEHIHKYAVELGIEVEIFHSNIEGEVINKVKHRLGTALTNSRARNLEEVREVREVARRGTWTDAIEDMEYLASERQRFPDTGNFDDIRDHFTDDFSYVRLDPIGLGRIEAD